jgi:thiol-disulfide isomerase/thioredoxin
MGEEMMKTKCMVLLLCGILVWGCEKKDTETSQNDPVIAKQGTGTPRKEASQKEKPVVAIPTKMGDQAYPLTGLEWVKGKPVTFEAGSVYVVEFWATWCGPCLRGIPHLTEIQHKFKDQKVTLISISKEKVETVKPFVEKWGEKMDYTVAVDMEGDVINGYMKAFKQGGIPHAFIVNGQGQLVWRGHPRVDLDRVLPEVVAGTFDFAAYAQKQAEEKAKREWIDNNIQAYFAGIQSDENETELANIAKVLLNEGGSNILNQLFWRILTEVSKEKRDMTLALALFENGQVQAAIETQTKAVELVKDNERMAKGMRKQLEKFQAAVK